jgi:hypothetical protein
LSPKHSGGCWNIFCHLFPGIPSHKNIFHRLFPGNLMTPFQSPYGYSLLRTPTLLFFPIIASPPTNQAPPPPKTLTMKVAMTVFA